MVALYEAAAGGPVGKLTGRPVGKVGTPGTATGGALTTAPWTAPKFPLKPHGGLLAAVQQEEGGV